MRRKFPTPYAVTHRHHSRYKGKRRPSAREREGTP